MGIGASLAGGLHNGWFLHAVDVPVAGRLGDVGGVAVGGVPGLQAMLWAMEK